jgi:predicted flap endonuclease-1-like 5' DNA nuclease
MNDTTNPAYTFGMATGEIISLLLLAFAIGMLLCWILRKMGICCQTRKQQPVTLSGSVKAVSIDVPKTKLYVVPNPALPSVQHHTPTIDLELPETGLHKPNVDSPDTRWTTGTLAAGGAALAGLAGKELMGKTELHIPNIDVPEVDPHKPSVDAMEIDPHKPITIDPYQPIVDAPDSEPHTPGVDLSLMEIDPHKPITIDPYQPIVDAPDMEVEASQPKAETESSNHNLINEWLNKAKDSVEHLAEKATPAAQDWLSKAKDSVEHLAEKATPTAQDWLSKAKDSVEHLTEKATPTAQDWLSKAKGLTEKLASDMHLKRDDLLKLEGIGPTFELVLHKAGIFTYQQLADMTPAQLKELLIAEDKQFHLHDPSSWPQQAALALAGEWEKLQEFQNSLTSSKDA